MYLMRARAYHLYRFNGEAPYENGGQPLTTLRGAAGICWVETPGVKCFAPIHSGQTERANQLPRVGHAVLAVVRGRVSETTLSVVQLGLSLVWSSSSPPLVADVRKIFKPGRVTKTDTISEDLGFRCGRAASLRRFPDLICWLLALL